MLIKVEIKANASEFFPQKNCQKKDPFSSQKTRKGANWQEKKTCRQ